MKKSNLKRNILECIQKVAESEIEKTNRAIHFALQFFISLKDLKNKKALNNNLLRQLF